MFALYCKCAIRCTEGICLEIVKLGSIGEVKVNGRYREEGAKNTAIGGIGRAMAAACLTDHLFSG